MSVSSEIRPGEDAHEDRQVEVRRLKRWVNIWLRSNAGGSPGFVSGFFYGNDQDGETWLEDLAVTRAHRIR